MVDRCCSSSTGETLTTELLAARLGRFLSDMLHLTNAKIVLASPRVVRVNVRHSGKEEHVILGPLNFKSSASLFGQILQHVSGGRHHAVSTPEQFVDLLVRACHADETDKEGISKNASLFEAIGAGNPGWTIDKAKWMPAADYENLINSVTESVDSSSKKTETSSDGSHDASRGEIFSRNSSRDVIMQPAPFARAGSPGSSMDFESGESQFEATGTKWKRTLYGKLICLSHRSKCSEALMHKKAIPTRSSSCRTAPNAEKR